MRRIHHLLAATVAVVFCVTATAATPPPPTATVVVSGIEYSGDQRLPVLKPGDTVMITVRPANLIDYSYTITVDTTEPLKQVQGPVVGVDTLGTAAAIASLDVQQPNNALAASDLDQSLLSEYQQLAQDIDNLATDVAHAVNSVEAAHTSLNADLAGSSQWPQTFRDALAAFRITAFGSAGSDACSGSTALCTRLAQLRRRVDVLKRKAAVLPFGANAPAPATVTAFAALVDSLATTLTTIEQQMTTTQARVDRWARIMTSNPIPEVAQTFIVANDSTRYTAHVKRVALDANGVMPTTDKVEETLAEIVFEGHALSRFLISTGLAGIYKPDDFSYDIVSSIGANNTKSFHVARTQSSRTTLKPVVTIGAYTHPVDNFRPDAKGLRPFFCVGSEINASASTYLLGGGIDTPYGLVLSIGVTNYRKTVLGDGWTLGQQVPANADGSGPLITPLPVKSRNAFGYYFGIQFRPAIFSKFLGFQKGT